MKKQKLSTLLMEIELAEALKSKLCVSLYSAILLLGLVPEETSLCVHKKYVYEYIAAWFVTAKIWILPKYPSIVDLINYEYCHRIKHYIEAKMDIFLKIRCKRYVRIPFI